MVLTAPKNFLLDSFKSIPKVLHDIKVIPRYFKLFTHCKSRLLSIIEPSFIVILGPHIMHFDLSSLNLTPKSLPTSRQISNIRCKSNTEADNSNKSSAYITQPT